ncbi:MAG TPA: hypothetical protein VFO77_14580, partial [Actinoplanes sp.]|nr:hypothetical protein [Actinoplanes sp.]
RGPAHEPAATVAMEVPHMSVELKLGLTTLAVGVGGAAANFWAREAFPTTWGGPNIGGGMLLILCYLAAAAGAGLVIAGLVSRRKQIDG